MEHDKMEIMHFDRSQNVEDNPPIDLSDIVGIKGTVYKAQDLLEVSRVLLQPQAHVQRAYEILLHKESNNRPSDDITQ